MSPRVILSNKFDWSVSKCNVAETSQKHLFRQSQSLFWTQNLTYVFFDSDWILKFPLHRGEESLNKPVSIVTASSPWRVLDDHTIVIIKMMCPSQEDRCIFLRVQCWTMSHQNDIPPSQQSRWSRLFSPKILATISSIWQGSPKISQYAFAWVSASIHALFQKLQFFGFFQMSCHLFKPS